MAFDDDFINRVRARASIARYAGRKLAFDQRKSQPAKGDFWACCPFHGEKTPSFHVLEKKGVFKCFGCGESGDVFTLAMKLEGLSFREAVERLAGDAGVPLPEESPRAVAQARQRDRLRAALLAAQEAFRGALHGREGKAARAYLERRGLGDRATLDQFGIGFAPSGWTWAIERLTKTFSIEELIGAGLAKEGQDGRRPIDTFRDRIIFPIEDGQGRLIGFGGRLIEPGEPKYLNSPETALFSKGKSLYRLHVARAQAAQRKATGLVVAEGYLDVIAFERAGIPAVAPLGTALTPEQLELIWRAGPEPVLCFDGDAAGRRAADRALDLALPLLSPAQTLRIAMLPQGQDPDDLYRSGGAEALAAALTAARSAADALFARERDQAPLITPEARAGFKERLRRAAAKIGHAETRKQYLSELLARADAELWGRQQRARGPRTGARDRPRGPTVAATEELKGRLKAPRGAELEDIVRLPVDLPRLLAQGAENLGVLAIPDPDLARIRDALLDLYARAETVDRAHVSRHLQQSGEERAARRMERWPKSARVNDDEASLVEEAAEAQWLALVSLHLMQRDSQGGDARRAVDDALDDAAFARRQAELRALRERAADALRFGADGAIR